MQYFMKKKCLFYLQYYVRTFFFGGGGPYHQVGNSFGGQTVQFDPHRKDHLDKLLPYFQPA